MVARQEGIYALHHVVPVIEQVEGHDRHDDEENDRVDDAGYRGKQGVQQLGAPGLQRIADIRQRAAQHGF